MEVETHAVPNNDVLTHVLEGVAGILRKEKENYQDVIFNVSSGEKLLGCAALSAAFVNGLKAVAIVNGEPLLLPVLKFSYAELISEPKLQILRALEALQGNAKSLVDLEAKADVEKSLLSYHIRGGRESTDLHRRCTGA